jgi:hypothetical protein
MGKKFKHICWFMVFSCWLFLTSGVFAQLERPEAPRQDAAKGKLAEPYVDGSFGFALRPPAGSTCKAEKKMLGPANYEITRFSQPQYDWFLSVRLSQDARPPDAELLSEKLVDNLQEQYEDIKALSHKDTQIAGRRGARLAVRFTFSEPVSLSDYEKKAWLHQQAVIQKEPGECFALILLTPFDDRDIATETFDRIVQSFEIKRTPQDEKRLHEALERGTRLLQSIAEDKNSFSDKLIKETFLLIERDGKEVGFIGMQEEAVNLEGRRGVRLYHWNWIFEDNGGVSNYNHVMYFSTNLMQEEWEYRMQMITPPGSGIQRQVLLDMESALRRKDKLLIEYPKKLETMERDNKVLEVGASYAPSGLLSLFPRLVDLDSPELYAFSSYDQDRRGLILRTIKIVGREKILNRGQSTQAWKLEDSEGLTPPVTSIYVDRTGQILRMTAGNMNMRLTSRDYVQRKFKTKVNDAQKTIQTHLENYQRKLRHKRPEADTNKGKRRNTK